MSTKDKITERITSLTGCLHVELVDRGNSAIKCALKLVQDFNLKLSLPDQGGWLSYEKIAKQMEIPVEKYKTSNGLIVKCEDVEARVVVEPTGYFAEQKSPHTIRKNSEVLVLDVSGSLGRPSVKQFNADIILGSFGEGKAVDLGYGGFFATSNYDDFSMLQNEAEEFKFDKKRLEELWEKLQKIDERHSFIKKHCDKIKADLKGFDIIYPEHDGLVVVVAFKTEKERDKIIQYCKENGYETEICPRDIRVNIPAVSIEVKRLKHD